MSVDLSEQRADSRIQARTRSHVLSVDVEDYFQVEAFADRISRCSWDDWPSRVERSTLRVLDLLEEHNATATFFLVGWVARRFPELVRRVQASGHELACHSYWHRTVYSLNPKVFREDTRRAKAVIEQAAGIQVVGYRAPSWSITRDCLWALDVLAEEGFLYDSSIYPIRHDLYGVPEAKRFPYTHRSHCGRTIREFPPATIRMLGMNFPVAGGGYLRIFPAVCTRLAFFMFEKFYRERVVVYLHPWELDPEQPRVAAGLRSRFRHYTNLRRMEGRVAELLRRYKFVRFCDVLAENDDHAGRTESAAQSRAQA